MSINLRLLSPDAYDALEALCEEREWPVPHGYLAVEETAYLAVRLKFVQDSEEVFPRGKWATIQHIQQLVEEYAKGEEK